MAGQGNEIIVPWYGRPFISIRPSSRSELHCSDGVLEKWKFKIMRKNKSQGIVLPVPHRITRKKSITSFIIFLVLCSPVLSQEHADFVIVGDPQTYSILDKYEQPLSESAKDLFPPFSPLQIVEGDATLGDEITRASKIRFNRSSYYLLLDDNGNYVGGSRNSYRQIFRKCQIIEDTIQVTKSGALLLSKKYPAQGKRVYLENGCTVIRVFKYRNYYYVKCLGIKEAYGWCSFASKNAWKKIKSIGKKQKISAGNTMLDRVAARIESANKMYIQYFEHFNRITKQQNSIPQWHYTVDSDMIQCTLKEPYKNSEQLKESTYYLVQDIENMLHGRPFRLQYQQGEITVRRRN